jgi:hypothetical protein
MIMTWQSRAHNRPAAAQFRLFGTSLVFAWTRRGKLYRLPRARLTAHDIPMAK